MQGTQFKIILQIANEITTITLVHVQKEDTHTKVGVSLSRAILHYKKLNGDYLPIILL